MGLSNGALDGLVRGSLARWRVPGAVVGVSLDGSDEVRAFGVADLRTGVPPAPGTTFRVASVTKPFTAALALSLVADGLLDLDEPVPVPLPSPGVTARSLLAHLGGFEGELGDLARFGDGDDALERALAEAPSLRRLVPPGRYWSYCNAGYWVVGALCARRAGTTYEDALRRRVLEPLGLERTSFAEPEATGHAERAPGTCDHEPAPERPYPRARRPSGGLTSDAGDLLRFGAAHLAGDPPFRLTEPEAPTPRGGYALGWAVQTFEGVRVWSHDGTYGGFQSRLAVVPDARLVLAVLTNGDAGAAVVREVAEGVLEAACGLRIRQPATVDLPAAELDALAGRYAGSESEVDVRRTDGALVLDVLSVDAATGERVPQPRVDARPLGGRRFALVGGVWDGVPFDFLPSAGAPEFVRLASRLVPRT